MKLPKDAFSTASGTYKRKSSCFSRESQNYAALIHCHSVYLPVTLFGSYPLSFSIFTSYSIRLLSIVIQYIYQLLYSRIKLTEWTNLNKMEDKIFRLRMRPINPMKIRLTFPLLHEQVNIFTYLGRLSLVSPEWSGYMIKNCFSVWGKY